MSTSGGLARCFVIWLCVLQMPAGLALPSTWHYYKSSGKGLDRVVDEWPHLPQSHCGDAAQSPVNIVPKDTQLDDRLAPVSFLIEKADPDSALDGFRLINDGHKIELVPEDVSVVMQFGKTGHFQLVNVHMHWGSANSVGSEHTINGKRYLAEIHFVTFDKTKYATASEAAGKTGGLAVLGVLVELGAENPAFKAITDKFSPEFVQKTTDRSPSASLRLSIHDLLPNRHLSKYYRYMGSLTTPMCTENVLWTVLDDTLKVSQSQIDKLRTLKFPGNLGMMVNNYRPIQPLNPTDNPYIYLRVISRSFENELQPTLMVMGFSAVVCLVIIKMLISYFFPGGQAN